ncbi:MAG: ferrochelatase [Pseudomonadota bacterium]
MADTETISEPVGKISTLVIDHPSVPFGKTGLLLVNLGTPDGTDYWSIRRYLSEFLSDRRVIEIPMLAWQPLLQGIILSIRPSKSGEAYKKIWMKDLDKSPLLHYTEEQTRKLAERIGKDDLIVDFAMRYGNPSMESKIEALRKQGCERIAVVPLYPQYSATTTGSVYDQTFRSLAKLRWQPAIRTAPPFYSDPDYIGALARSLDRQVKALDFEPQVLLLSYHGIPKSYFMKGDPYHCHCQKTTRLVREYLGWDESFCRTTFQSRFGPQEWIQPYTSETLETLPKEGITRVAVAAPAFISDCVETLEEIAIEGKEEFIEAGGTQFAALECLNDSDECIDFLVALARKQLAGWDQF